MEQQQLSIDAHQINEGYYLGERYQLGQLQGEYYVAYTYADVRRYRFHRFMVFVTILYVLAMLAYIFLIFSNLLSDIFYSSANRFFPGYFIPMAINPFIMIYGNAQRRKWGNRPVISPRNRHLRVYVYQYGLVKQTNQKSEVVRWSDLYNMKYEPLQPLQPANLQKSLPKAKQMAGIKLVLSHHHKVKLNGALRNLDNLAQQINGRNLANKKATGQPHD